MVAIVGDASKPLERRRNSAIATWPQNVANHHARMAVIRRFAASHSPRGVAQRLSMDGQRHGLRGVTQRLSVCDVARRIPIGAWEAASDTMAAPAGGVASVGIE